MIRAALLGFALIMLTACTAKAPLTEGDPYAPVADHEVPMDFALDLTILVPPPPFQYPPPVAPSVIEAHLCPSRYVIFPDGALHYAPDVQNRGVTWLPPLARVLTRRQLAETWRLAEQLGLTDPQRSDPFINLKLVRAEPGEVVYLADFSAFDQRWNFIRRGPNGRAPDDALAQFIRHVAELAWADEMPAPELRNIPVRYDFGPDPYARYRELQN